MRAACPTVRVREDEMRREECDVVVIGSGMGGLSAAALLTSSGYRTLVVERLPRVGGRYSSIDYRGFRLTTGAVEVEMGGVVERVFDAVGAEFAVRVCPPFRYRVAGRDNELPPRGGLRKLVSLACSDEREAGVLMAALKRGLSWQEPSDSISVREWLLQYSQDERVLKTFWSLITPTHFVTDEELPAGAFFRYLRAPKGNGVGIPPEGNAALMGSLARAIEGRGGQVWTRCQARRIEVLDGSARGVVVERAGAAVHVAARAVVSNIGPGKTVDLAGANNFDRGYLKDLDETLKPAPFMYLQAASDRPLVDCSSLIFVPGRCLSVMHCPTLLCPEHAPEGRHLLGAGGVPVSVEPPYDLKGDRELLLQDLREHVPGFDRDAEVLTFSYFRGDWPGYRSRPGRDLPQRTSVENLYDVGDGVKPPGLIGLGACAASAEIVVEDIKRRVTPG